LILLLLAFRLSPLLNSDFGVPRFLAAGILQDQGLWRVVNLLIFVAFVVYLLARKLKIGKALDDRAAGIVKELELARAEKEAAEKELEQVRARLAGLDAEIASMKEQAKVEGEREVARINQMAASEAEKIGQLGQREVEGIARATRSELRQFMVDRSVVLAEASIRETIKPEDNRRIWSEFVEGLGEVKN
jgi:F-type H+-transporting ATPase subunit b